MLQVSTRGRSAADPLTAHGGLRQVNGRAATGERDHFSDAWSGDCVWCVRRLHGQTSLRETAIRLNLSRSSHVKLHQHSGGFPPKRS